MTYNLDEKYLLMMPHKHIFESQPPSSMSIKQGKNEVILDNKKEEILIQLGLEVINDKIVYVITDRSRKYLPATIASHLPIPLTEA